MVVFLTGANFAFSIYDMDGSGTVDAFYLGDVLRGLNLNPTNATIEKLGGTKKKGEKTLKVDEFLPIFSQCKKDKDHGGYEDFLECLKLYDKAENGLMLGAELSHTLLALGNPHHFPSFSTIFPVFPQKKKITIIFFVNR